jgi:riboflavin kinase / FMN adenylyltransferase
MVVTHGSLRASRGPWAVTIGNFDGVHLGHRALLERVKARARELGAGACVVSFEPHPREFFLKEAAPPRISTLRDKLEQMAQAGIDRVHVARFDTAFAALTPERFVHEILVHGLRVRWLAVGTDFRFGRGRAGDFATLQAAGRTHDFEVEAVPDVMADGERISSSAVRAALQAGELARAERLLGRRYLISGRVAQGARLGSELGFPTANIPLRRRPPLSGVYVVRVPGFGPGVASLGLRPTVNPVPRPLLEVHLLNAAPGPLYGRRLGVEFLAKLRDEEKYPDLQQLKSAIARDVERAEDYFARHG